MRKLEKVYPQHGLSSSKNGLQLVIFHYPVLFSTRYCRSDDNLWDCVSYSWTQHSVLSISYCHWSLGNYKIMLCISFSRTSITTFIAFKIKRTRKLKFYQYYMMIIIRAYKYRLEEPWNAPVSRSFDHAALTSKACNIFLYSVKTIL